MVAFLALYPPLANAVNVQHFSRSNSLAFEMLEDSHLERSHVYSDYELIFTLGGSWVLNPLSIQSSGSSGDPKPAIDDMFGVHFGAGYYFKPWLMFGVTGSYNDFDYNQRDNTGNIVRSGSESGFGDVEVKAKFRVMHEERYALSIMPLVTIPTHAGNFDPDTGTAYYQESFLSDGDYGFGAKVIYEYLLSFAQLNVNLGYKHNSGAHYPDFNQVDSLITAFGAYFPVYRSLGVNTEFSRAWELPFDDKMNPNELYVGVSGGITRKLHFYTGAGFGNLFQPSQVNSWRVAGGIKYTPKFWEKDDAPIVEVQQAQVIRGEPVAPAQIAVSEVPPVPVAAADVCNGAFIFGKSNTAVVRFNSDVAQLDSELQAKLDDIAKILVARNADVKQIIIVGHASATGSAEVNQEVSRKRAANITKLFVSAGVPAAKIKSEHKGSSDPIKNVSPAAAVNKRVEFKVQMEDRFQNCQ